MSNELAASKVVILEEEPRQRAVPALPTAVLGIVGVTERGPVNQPVLVQSFDEYTRTFGGFLANSNVPLALAGYFDNGGAVAYVVRTVHHANANDGTTKASKPATLTLKDRAATALDTLRFAGRWDGTYAHEVRVTVSPATSGAADAFNVVVERAGVVEERFANLAMAAASTTYVETVINDTRSGSRLIAVTDLASATAAPGNLPAFGTFGPLAGGEDGLTGLADTDFIGTTSGRNGLHALDTTAGITILAVPDRATPAVHNAMLFYCESVRAGACFAVLDPPAHASATDIVTYAATTAGLLGASEYGALYWPRVKILNPTKAVFGNVAELEVPPSGHIAGVYARVDASRPGGVFQPPAGPRKGVLAGIVGFETDEVLDEAKRDLVFPNLINPLTTFPGAGRHIDGARTLRADGAFPTVAERRGVSFIEQSLKAGLAYARHENITEALRASLTRTATAFLLIQLKNGAFASTDPKTAFFVDFGDALNPPSSMLERKVVGRIGLATAKPAEFIVVWFSQDTRALDLELATAT